MRKTRKSININIVIDIVGESLMNGKVIIVELEKRGMCFGTLPSPRPDGLMPQTYYARTKRNDSIQEFLEHLKRSNVLRFNPDVDVVSGILTDNDYCLTTAYLREYKINKILS